MSPGLADLLEDGRVAALVQVVLDGELVERLLDGLGVGGLPWPLFAPPLCAGRAREVGHAREVERARREVERARMAALRSCAAAHPLRTKYPLR